MVKKSVGKELMQCLNKHHYFNQRRDWSPFFKSITPNGLRL
jgi:hypothetical protein